MSAISPRDASDLANVAQEIFDAKQNIILVYAFNGTGKTRLSVAYKDLTKANNGGEHAGVYYNAYSEDLFYWDNDEENDGATIRLVVRPSTLNQYHSQFDEVNLRDKLSHYRPKYDFQFALHSDVEQGIESIRFFVNDDDTAESTREYIKISRGEERTFTWCFFLALFDVDGWTKQRSTHFFIDDPVSSLDDHNIFVTAASLLELIDTHFKSRKIIITTHHVGLFAILSDWLTKGEKPEAIEAKLLEKILKRDGKSIRLVGCSNDVFLYHLELLQTIKNAINSKQLYAYHFAIVRQILENVSSFLGAGHFSFVLRKLGFTDADEIANIVNTMSHKNVFRYEAKELVDDNVVLLTKIYEALMDKYNFRIH